jgi:hypothetical protein
LISQTASEHPAGFAGCFRQDIKIDLGHGQT